MILFCDTSALLKLYIVEQGSDALKTLVQVAEAVAVSLIAWTEAYAALSRRARKVAEDADAIERAKLALAAGWLHFVVLEIDLALVERAGDYADTFALRGYDSIQLASAFESGRFSQIPIFLLVMTRV